MRRLGSHRTGVSLLELTASTFLIGVCLVAALRAVGMTAMTQSGLADAAVAECLADDLLSEVMQKLYQDPSGDNALQADTAENRLDKTTFDDVDDYHNWQENPPQDGTGKTIAGLDDWTRRVRVEYVEAMEPELDSPIDAGAKRITVEVMKREQIRASRSGLRTRYGG